MTNEQRLSDSDAFQHAFALVGAMISDNESSGGAIPALAITNSQETISHAPTRSLTEGVRVVGDKLEGVVALMGLDWASDKHDVQLLEVGAEKPEHLVLKHGAESIERWVSALRERFGEGARIAVCLELAKGPIVSALEKYGGISRSLVVARCGEESARRHVGISLTLDPAVLVPEILSVRTLVGQLRLQIKVIRKVEAELAGRASKLDDYAYLSALKRKGSPLLTSIAEGAVSA